MDILVKVAKINRKPLNSDNEAKIRNMVAEIGMCQIFCQKFFGVKSPMVENENSRMLPLL